MTISYEKLGDINYELGKNSKAKKFYSHCLVLRENLVKEKKTDDILQDFAVTYDDIGLILNESSSFIEAEDFYKKSLDIRERLLKKSKDNNPLELRRDLTISYNRLGNLYNDMDNIILAKKFYEKCLDLCEQIVKESKNSVDADDHLVDSYINVACIQKTYNRNMLENAIKINNKLMKKCPEFVRFAERSSFLNNLLSELY